MNNMPVSSRYNDNEFATTTYKNLAKVKNYTLSFLVSRNVGILREDFIFIMVSEDVETDVIANGEYNM
jgi:hypothetical protein